MIARVTLILYLLILWPAPLGAYAQPSDPAQTKEYLEMLRDKVRNEASPVAPPIAPQPNEPAPSQAPHPQPDANKNLRVRKGTIPSDGRYWAFNRWYVDHSVLSVIINGTNQEHLVDTLERLNDLKKKGVLIGDIIVTGSNIAELSARGTYQLPEKLGVEQKPGGRRRPPIESPLRETPLGAVADELNLSNGVPTSAYRLVELYKVKYSPVWIVRYHGKDYVYEGLKDPRPLFSSGGQFQPRDDGSVF